MKNERAKKYIASVIWFSALWGIKEFILQPIIHKTKHGQKAIKK